MKSLKLIFFLSIGADIWAELVVAFFEESETGIDEVVQDCVPGFSDRLQASLVLLSSLFCSFLFSNLT